MQTISKYWMLVRLDGRGKVAVEEMMAAKTLIDELFPDFGERAVSDLQIQHHLSDIMYSNNPTQSRLAQACLRCSISSEIRQVCIDLERRFGNNHGFDRYDLFPLVLDDTLEHLKRPEPHSDYTPMAVKVLQTFDPRRSSLATWTSRVVTCDRELNAFLLLRGLYLVSDWAILNDTPPARLQTILRDFHRLSVESIAQARHLLESYHAIYRQERLRARRAGIGGKCQPPSSEQLQKIAILLDNPHLSPDTIFFRLQNLAEYLRQYRIHVRGGSICEESLDRPDTQLEVERQQVSNGDWEDEISKEEFLQNYRQQFLACLEQAIAQVIQKWTNRQKNDKIQQFFQGLELFHCHGRSMKEIATSIGLKEQYQVTRLLKLKDFRADIRQQMLQDLRRAIFNMAASYTDAAQLQRQEQFIEDALDEQVAIVIREAENEASLAKNHPLKSLFAQYLCRHLHLRKNLP